MYLQKTKYYCPDCKTHDHWANEPEKCSSLTLASGGRESPEAVATPSRGSVGVGEQRPVNEPKVDRDTQAGNAPAGPIEQAREFIKRHVGRPKVYPDAKIRHKEYMRAWRASKHRLP